MARKTNCTINGKEYYRIYRKVGMKVNKDGIWVDDRKAFYGSSKKEAEQQYHEYMKRKESGLNGSMCLGQHIDEYINVIFRQKTDLARTTKDKYIADYERILKPHPLAGRPITEVTAMDLQHFYNTVEASITGIRSVHNLLTHFYKNMELQGVCRNITYSVTPPKKPVDVSDTDEIDVWEDKDLQKLVSATEGHRLRLLAILAVNTGGRLAELLAIEPDKDIRDGVLYITKQLIEKSAKKDGVSHYLDELKTPSSRRAIPLSDEVLHEINVHRKWQREEMMANGYRTTLLFTTDSGRFYYRKNIHTAFERLYKKLDIPFHKFHAFRHTFGTNLSRAGVPIEETSKLMGHSDISVTAKYYINVNAERKRDAIEKILQYSFGE